MSEREYYDDPRHEKWDQIWRELNRRTLIRQAPEGIYDWMMQTLGKMAPPDTTHAIMDWDESFAKYDAEIARRVALSKIPEAERKMFDWPWASWNSYIDPAEGGVLAVVAGGDGTGKTAVAECVAEYWARRGNKVVFVHFELSKIIMLDRRAARHTAIARRRLKMAGDLSFDDMQKIEIAKKKLLQWPGAITYVHTPGKSIELVLRELTALKGQGKCDVAIVDYLEKAAPSPAQLKAYGSQIFAREANDVELLKNWSENNEIPVLALSQFNKLGKASTFDNLDRTMIRGSGEKTEKANVVVLLKPVKDQEGLINVRIDKNTLGPHGTFQQMLDGPHFQVFDIYRDPLNK